MNTKKAPRCIIFDFDGVIANTEAGRYKVLSELMEEYHNIKLGEHHPIDNLVGLHTTSFLKEYFPQLTLEEVNKLSKDRYKAYFENLTDYCIVYPLAVESVAAIAEKFDVKMATANDRKNIEVLLKHIGILQYFSHIYTREDLEKNGKKYYPNILSHLSYSPEECWVIEDSLVGISSAKEAGFTTVLFNRYDNPEAKKYADYIITSYPELMNLLGI